MPGATSITPSAIATLSNASKVLGDAAQGKVDRDSLSSLLGGGPGSIDTSALTSQLMGGSGKSHGPSFFDPSYIFISGTLQLVGTGLFIFGTKMREPKYVFWGVACYCISWDYTSALCWVLTVMFGLAGKMFE